ncbi:hypothetical protein L596_023979 [Steinernema carpocapsae]|uniref:Uncharacterized protein n=1 Tax=Steinernema carpocapsae TaxID=34508 RepID=A0A4U5MFD4_STECR|nr:hypothetical protein L596_023979 [Steinernema carpocapsae]
MRQEYQHRSRSSSWAQRFPSDEWSDKNYAAASKRSFLTKIKDSVRPKGIMKRQGLDSREAMLYPQQQTGHQTSWEGRYNAPESWRTSYADSKNFHSGGRTTTERFETNKRSEEVERSAKRRSRSRHDVQRGQDYEWQRGGFNRSSSIGPAFSEGGYRSGYDDGGHFGRQQYYATHRRSSNCTNQPSLLARNSGLHRDHNCYYRSGAKAYSYSDLSRSGQFEMNHLENDCLQLRDCLLMPLPRHEDAYRIQGGHESYRHESSGRRLQRYGPSYHQ